MLFSNTFDAVYSFISFSFTNIVTLNNILLSLTFHNHFNLKNKDLTTSTTIAKTGLRHQ